MGVLAGQKERFREEGQYLQGQDRGGVWGSSAYCARGGGAQWLDVDHVVERTRHGYPCEHGKVCFVVLRSPGRWILTCLPDSQTPELAECSVKAGFQFTPEGGAVLLMVNDSVSMINPASSLRQLLEVKALRDHVVVSEVHRCASYARYLASPRTKDVVIGLNLPSSGSPSGTTLEWVRSTQTGNFKAKADDSGQRNYYPLYKLVSVREASDNTGRRHSLDNPIEDEVSPLRVAVPPWMSHT